MNAEGKRMDAEKQVERKESNTQVRKDPDVDIGRSLLVVVSWEGRYAPRSSLRGASPGASRRVAPLPQINWKVSNGNQDVTGATPLSLARQLLALWTGPPRGGTTNAGFPRTPCL
jgi:hypothetical protein